MRRRNMSIVEEGILRSHIRMMILEAEVPRSEIINLRPGSSEKPIGTPGTTALKVIGALLATSWMAKYIEGDCLDPSKFGMPIPNASVEFVKFQGLSKAADLTGKPDVLKTRQRTKVSDWGVALTKDVDGDGTNSDYMNLGGFAGTMAYIQASIGSGAGPIWPSKDKTQRANLSAPAAGSTVNVDGGKTEYEKLLSFVKTLVNTQCVGAMNDAKVKQMVDSQFATRAAFIEFVKTYTDTMYKDFDALVQSHKKEFIDSANVKPHSTAEAAIQRAATAYKNASSAIK